MKKVILTFLFAFILFGMLFNSAFVLAEEGDNTSDSGNDDVTVTDNSGSDDSEDVLEASDDSEDEDELEVETEDEDEKDRIRERIKERIRDRDKIRTEFTKEVVLEDGTVIKIERKVEVNNGEVKIKIKRTYIFPDGTEKVVEIEVERNSEGISREIQIEGENVNIDSDLEIDDQFEGDESEIEAILSNGNITKIKILPERAREIILERLRTRNITNMTLEEIEERNIPRVVYNVETNQNGRFLGVFKLRLRTQTHIDPETGEVVDVNRPWWAFLVSVPEEETDEIAADDANTEEDTNVTDENNSLSETG